MLRNIKGLQLVSPGVECQRYYLTFLLIAILTIAISYPFFQYLGGAIALGVFIFLGLEMVFRFGRTLWVILDVYLVLAVLTWLIAPLFFYFYFDTSYFLPEGGEKAMRIDLNTYFSFVLPGTMAMILGVRFPVQRIFSSSKLRTLKEFTGGLSLKRPTYLGWLLIGISILAFLIDPYINSSFKFVNFLVSKLYFVGFLYLYFAKEKSPIIYLILAMLPSLYVGVQHGLFGEFIYLLLLGGVVLTIGKKMSFGFKFFFILFSFFGVIFLQSVKKQYRVYLKDHKPNTFQLVHTSVEHLINPGLIFSNQNMFQVAYRLNQGWLIAATMDRVPREIPFAKGETIRNTALAILLPRMIWEDKPQAGGAENLDRFLGIRNLHYSMNISPMGEAWANWSYYGIIFMFFYGLILGLSFHLLLFLIQYHPTLLLWIPLIFFHVIKTETDTLTTMNHLFKTGVFIFLFYTFFNVFFKIKL